MNFWTLFFFLLACKPGAALYELSSFLQALGQCHQHSPTRAAAAAAAKSLQSCSTLCDPREGSPPGSPVPGILQARTLEWVAISFSNAWKGKVKVKSLSHVQLFETPWTAAHQAPPSTGFSRQEYWSGVPLPSPDYFARSPLIILGGIINSGFLSYDTITDCLHKT